MIYTICKKTLQYKPVSLKVVSFVVLSSTLLAIMAYVYGHVEGFNTGTKTLTDVEKAIIISKQDTFSEEKFKEYLVELNIKFPHIVYAQAVLETGHFKSNVFINNQNLFGMKQARIRATTNAGTEMGHAVYKHWRESVVDYALFQCAFLMNISTEDGYYQYLKANYAESPQYINKVKHIAEKLKQQLKNGKK